MKAPGRAPKQSVVPNGAADPTAGTHLATEAEGCATACAGASVMPAQIATAIDERILNYSLRAVCSVSLSLSDFCTGPIRGLRRATAKPAPLEPPPMPPSQ